MSTYFDFNVYSHTISFDGENLLVSVLSGDILMSFKYNNILQIAWVPTPFKDKLEDIDIKNFGFCYLSVEKSKIALIYKYKHIYICEYNFTNYISKPINWLEIFDPHCKDGEEFEYKLIKFMDESNLFICRESNQELKYYIINVSDNDNIAWHDVSYIVKTNEFNYVNNKLLFTRTGATKDNCKVFIYNKNTNNINVKTVTIGEIDDFCGSRYQQKLIISKNNKVYTISYDKLFSDEYTNAESDWKEYNINFEDSKEFITCVGICKSFMIACTYKNIYIKSINTQVVDNTEWVKINIIEYTDTEFNITKNDEFFDKTKLFWCNLYNVNDDVVLSTLDGQTFYLVINYKDKKIIPTRFPKLMLNNTTIKKSLSEIKFRDMYKVEYIVNQVSQSSS